MGQTGEFTCLECGYVSKYNKRLASHIKSKHGLDWLPYLAKHDRSEERTCHCGKKFQNNRYPGGPNQHGRPRVHCSDECNRVAVGCKFYGVEPEVYHEHVKKGCAICGSKISLGGKRKLCIDHDHATGKFRGLLCNDCNSYRVGMNTLETAKKVVEYLSTQSVV